MIVWFYEMLSGHFLFSSVNGLYLMQQFPGSQKIVLSMNMQILVVSGTWMVGPDFLTDESLCGFNDHVRQSDQG